MLFLLVSTTIYARIKKVTLSHHIKLPFHQAVSVKPFITEACVRTGVELWPASPCENTKCAVNTGVFQDPQGLPGRGRRSAIMPASRRDDRRPDATEKPEL